MRTQIMFPTTTIFSSISTDVIVILGYWTWKEPEKKINTKNAKKKFSQKKWKKTVKTNFLAKKKMVEPVSNCIEHLMTDYLIEIDEMKTKKKLWRNFYWRFFSIIKRSEKLRQQKIMCAQALDVCRFCFCFLDLFR